MKSRSILFGFPLTAAALVCACSQPAMEDAASTESDTEAIRAVIEGEIAAVNAGDVDAFFGILSEDVEAIPPNEPPVKGEEARQWIRAFMDQYSVQLDSYSNEELVVSGDWAFQRYSFEWTVTPKDEGEPFTQTGAGIHILSRQNDGPWKLSKDIWNTDSPPPSSEEP